MGGEMVFNIRFSRNGNGLQNMNLLFKQNISRDNGTYGYITSSKLESFGA